MSREDPTGLASCPPGAECVNVPPPTPSEPGNPGAAVFAQSSPPPSGGHVPAGVQQLAARAAQGGPHSAAAHSLAENYGGTTGGGTNGNGTAFTFAGVAGSIAASINGIVVQAESDTQDDNTLLGTIVAMPEAFGVEGGVERAAGKVGGGAAEAVQTAEAIVHGNSKLSSKIAYLYQLFTAAGEFLKNGVTQNLASRYSKTFMQDKVIVRIDEGARSEMLSKERLMTITNPGPLNKEPWAGTGQ